MRAGTSMVVYVLTKKENKLLIIFCYNTVMYLFSELPSDLEDIDTTLGPPPAWFRPEISLYSQGSYPSYGYSYGSGYAGLGDREEEIEANPIEELQELKYKQELNKKIPSIAYRYTAIDPLSPMFRERRAKYGFGEITAKKAALPLLIAALAIYFLFLRKPA